MKCTGVIWQRCFVGWVLRLRELLFFFFSLKVFSRTERVHVCAPYGLVFLYRKYLWCRRQIRDFCFLQAKTTTSVVANKNGKNYKCHQCPKVFSNTVEMGRHKKAAHRDTSRNNIKKVVSAFSAPNDNEQKYRSTIITTADYETEFYKNVCGNVK